MKKKVLKKIKEKKKERKIYINEGILNEMRFLKGLSMVKWDKFKQQNTLILSYKPKFEINSHEFILI